MTRSRVATRSQVTPVLLPDGSPCPTCRKLLEHLEIRGLSAHTRYAYACDLVLLDRWLDNRGLVLSNLTAEDLHTFIALERRRNSHPRSINRRLHTLRLYYRFVVGQELPGGDEPVAAFRRHRRDYEMGLQVVLRRSTRRLRVREPRTLAEPLSIEQALSANVSESVP